MALVGGTNAGQYLERKVATYAVAFVDRHRVRPSATRSLLARVEIPPSLADRG